MNKIKEKNKKEKIKKRNSKKKKPKKYIEKLYVYMEQCHLFSFIFCLTLIT